MNKASLHPHGIKVVKNRSDIGAGTRGADMGIDAIEIAAINAGNDYFNRLPFTDVKTRNESIYNKVKNSFAKRIEDVYQQCTRVSKVVKTTLNDGFFPVVLSGDHSSSAGTVSGVKAAFPNQKLGIIWIDAHADLHSPYTSPSGNIHGMPVAAIISNDNLACQINEVGRPTEKYWSALKNIGVRGPKILPQHLVYFGVRDTEEPEDEQIRKLGIKNYMVDEVRFRGVKTCVEETLEILKDCDHIYISFDVDSMDRYSVSDGTGTPVEKGFDPREIKSILSLLLSSKKVVCFELVEVNPLLDTKGNKMADTAFEILNDFTNNLSEL